MLTKLQINIFFMIAISSITVCSDDSLDDGYDKVTSCIESIEEEQIKEENTIAKYPEFFEKLHQEKINNFLNDESQKMQKSVESFLDNSLFKQIKKQFLILNNNDSSDFKIDKIGLGSAFLTMGTFLGCNRIINSGFIRTKVMPKRLLALGYGYVVYKLVATNDKVKKDISAFLDKIKEN